MKSNEYRKDLVERYDVQQEGDTLYIKGASFLPQKIDYADNDSVKIVASNAANTADGIYDLIKNNCDTQNPDISSKAHIEMYLALAGLTCEIYMKSIIYNENLHGGTIYKGHKLDELFKTIPNTIQDKIRAKIPNIDTVLSAVGNLFTILRYDFEQNHIQGDYFIVFDLMEELKTISDSYPKKTIGSMRSANGVLFIE